MSERGLPGAVLFDLDGTIADSEPLIANALQLMLAAHGYEVTYEQVVSILGPPLAGMVEGLIGRPATETELDSMRREYLRHYNATLDQVQALPGADDLLDALEAAGVPLAVVTNKREDGAHDQLRAMGWAGRFRTVIGADTAGAPKPSPAPAIEALRRLEVAPEAAAFVGDTETDMQCALAAGIPVRVGLAHARAEGLLREAGATLICTHLEDVRRALLEIGAPS